MTILCIGLMYVSKIWVYYYALPFFSLVVHYFILLLPKGVRLVEKWNDQFFLRKMLVYPMISSKFYMYLYISMIIILVSQFECLLSQCILSFLPPTWWNRKSRDATHAQLPSSRRWRCSTWGDGPTVTKGFATQTGALRLPTFGGFPKIGVQYPKMEGLKNNGKPYFVMDDLGVPWFSETPISVYAFGLLDMFLLYIL